MPHHAWHALYLSHASDVAQPRAELIALTSVMLLSLDPPLPAWKEYVMVFP